jgi:ADP-ribose pyrophosphatase YjhB (NUDIX family)
MNEDTRRPIPGVGIAVIRDGALLMVKRGRGPNAGLWAIPGGKVEYGESMPKAAVRELREETGIEVELEGVVWVGDAMGPGHPPDWHYTLVDYRARMIGGRLAAADDAEEVAWVPLGEVLDLPVTPTMPGLVASLLAERAGGDPDEVG